jgi:predicted nucleic acid-binding protein
MNYLLDSNTIINIAGDRLPASSYVKLKAIVQDLAFISVISRIEVLGFNGDLDEMSTCEGLIGELIEISLSENIVQKTIELRKTHSKIKLPDLIIAATALEYSLQLITHNLYDFRNINGLMMIDSHNL